MYSHRSMETLASSVVHKKIIIKIKTIKTAAVNHRATVKIDKSDTMPCNIIYIYINGLCPMVQCII